MYNVNDTLQAPREEIELDLKPAAENLGITLADLAQQVRRAFYGAEAQRIPRTREDVKVMVRYPEAERQFGGQPQRDAGPHAGRTRGAV